MACYSLAEWVNYEVQQIFLGSIGPNLGVGQDGKRAGVNIVRLAATFEEAVQGLQEYLRGLPGFNKECSPEGMGEGWRVPLKQVYALIHWESIYELLLELSEREEKEDDGGHRDPPPLEESCWMDDAGGWVLYG